MNLPDEIRNFYDRLQFPGQYTVQDLKYHYPEIKNYYLNKIATHLQGSTVLDVGCGTGLVTHVMAQYFPDCKFTGIDFAQSIEFAKKFCTENKIKNIDFQLANLLHFPTNHKFDTVICQGVLHHIPDQLGAVEKLKDLIKPGGILIVGVYHPWGKILKKFFTLTYDNEPVLKHDQENNPYEITYKKKEICKLFNEFELIAYYPKWQKISALIRSNSGGLSMYVWRKNV
jgi:2-polyprenyl-3-methyl-5-hydroxy-6-metoxy-1,4-benzoquinol methylase